MEVLVDELPEVTYEVTIHDLEDGARRSFDRQRVLDVDLWQDKMPIRKDDLTERRGPLYLLVNNVRQITLINYENVRDLGRSELDLPRILLHTSDESLYLLSFVLVHQEQLHGCLLMLDVILLVFLGVRCLHILF